MGDRLASTRMYSFSGTEWFQINYNIWSGYWLGGYLSMPSKTWKWTDSSNSIFRPWATG